MPPRTIEDKSLLRCTLRKSADVFAKLVLCASYAVCGITALTVVFTGVVVICAVIWKVIEEPAHYFAYNIAAGVVAFLALLSAIPWYVYVGIAAVAAIFGYSLLWCVARELTEEDYQSEIAKSIACLLVLLVGLGLVGPGLVLVGLVLVLVGLDETKAFLFLGAYLHYRKRMKEERK